MSMAERYEQVYGSPRPVDEPAAAVPSLSSMLGNAPPFTEEQARSFRVARARAEIAAAQRVEAAQAERERREFSRHLLEHTSVGQLLR